MAGVKLRAEPRAWFVPAMDALAWACALLSLVSERAANWLSNKGSTAIAIRGIKIVAD